MSCLEPRIRVDAAATATFQCDSRISFVFIPLKKGLISFVSPVKPSENDLRPTPRPTIESNRQIGVTQAYTTELKGRQMTLRFGAVDGLSDQQRQQLSRAIAKCWHDHEFRNQLLDKPREALAEFDIEYSEALSDIAMWLPETPADLIPLSDDAPSTLLACCSSSSIFCRLPD